MPVADILKERMPCILPQVVFINCNIFLASVEVEDRGVPGFAAMGFLIGDRGFECFTSRCRGVRTGSGGEGIIDGNPIEEESSSSSGRDGDWSEPTRGRYFRSHGVGDFSL